MARIEGAAPESGGFVSGLFLRLIYWLTRRKVGRVILPVRITGHRPRILLGYGMMEQGLAGSHALPDALKTLASVRVSTLVGSPF